MKQQVKKWNTKRVHHEQNATQKRCNINKVQHEKKVEHGKIAKRKKVCNMELLQHEKSAICKECNTGNCDMKECNK